MVSAWPEPPSAMSAEKSAGVRDGMQAFAFGTSETPPNGPGKEESEKRSQLPRHNWQSWSSVITPVTPLAKREVRYPTLKMRLASADGPLPTPPLTKFSLSARKFRGMKLDHSSGGGPLEPSPNPSPLLAMLRRSLASSLSGDELRQAVTGKTVYLDVSGFELPIHYLGNGRMSGSRPRHRHALHTKGVDETLLASGHNMSVISA